MKFNMGCGIRKLPGFVNVDAVQECAPDQIVDLEVTPWPWKSNVAEEIRFIHSLEHMGADPKVFLEIMKEIYRISMNGCIVQINAPHPRHDNYIGDPTHVRPITLQMLALLDRKKCEIIAEKGGANTPFAKYIGVDFEIINNETVVDEPYFSEFKKGNLTQKSLEHLVRSSFNVARELRITLKVIKSNTQSSENHKE